MCTLLLMALLRVLRHMKKTGEKTLSRTRSLLMSIYAVVTPTQSFWPSHYLSLARSAAASEVGCIRIPLTTLYDDLLGGIVELRAPRKQLPLLFSYKLSAPEDVRLEVESFWWCKLLWWAMSCYMHRNALVLMSQNVKVGSYMHAVFVSLHPFGPTPDANTVLSHSLLDFSPPPPYSRASEDLEDIASVSTPPSALFYSMLYENARSISLDCAPYHRLEECIRGLQASLAQGDYLTIGLTTRAGPTAYSFWHPDTIITAIPFFPRAYLRKRTQTARNTAGGGERTTTPLYITLPRVLSLLTSGPEPFKIELVRNVSEEYAHFLWRSVDDLEDDREIRDAFVHEWGVEAWREERVCTAWEAGLVDAGLLAGWAIVVCK
ncbi:hypothetical protein ONZ51_g893 [Trametes cubensis]|uniref:Uncharacterized protein n=1 Tax=Trametes cubensis TaxID=1111947 RepID=A0AAD7XGD0_9APHY|nr:hypothetical protein ONZ51_g893 [Trametes cubensis]